MPMMTNRACIACQCFFQHDFYGYSFGQSYFLNIFKMLLLFTTFYYVFLSWQFQLYLSQLIGQNHAARTSRVQIVIGYQDCVFT